MNTVFHFCKCMPITVYCPLIVESNNYTQMIAFRPLCFSATCLVSPSLRSPTSSVAFQNSYKHFCLWPDLRTHRKMSFFFYMSGLSEHPARVTRVILKAFNSSASLQTAHDTFCSCIYHILFTCIKTSCTIILFIFLDFIISLCCIVGGARVIRF